MKLAIYAALKPLRTRQQLLFALRCAAIGLAVSAVLGLVVGTIRLMFGLELALAARVAVLAAGPVLGFLIGLLLQRGSSTGVLTD